MTFDELQSLTEKNTKGIADLIRVAGLNLEATKHLTGSVTEFSSSATESLTKLEDFIAKLGEKLDQYAKAAEERSKELDERMNALIHTVDDLVRDRWRRKNGEPENG